MFLAVILMPTIIIRNSNTIEYLTSNIKPEVEFGIHAT